MGTSGGTEQESLEAEIREAAAKGRAYNTGYYFVREETAEGPRIRGIGANRSHELDAVPTVSADFIRNLLLGLDGNPSSLPQGLRLSGVQIKGSLNLDCASAGNGGRLPALELKYCYFNKPISAKHLEIELFDFWGSVLPSLDASFIRVSGAVGLYDVIFTALEPKVELCWANIGGPVGLSDVQTLHDGASIAVSLFQSRVGGTFSMTTQKGHVRPPLIRMAIFDSRFESSFDCSASSFRLFDASAIKADAGLSLNNVKFVCPEKFEAQKSYKFGLSLKHAEIQGDVDLGRAHFEVGARGISVVGMRISGTLLMCDAIVNGGITLMGARIEGGWEAQGSHFIGNSTGAAMGWAIAAREAFFGQTVLLNKSGEGSTICEGHVRMRRTRIEGDLNLSGTIFRVNPEEEDQDNLGRWSLDATAIQVAGSILLGGGGRPGAHCTNGARFDQARIGCDLELTGAVMQRDDATTGFSLRDASVIGRLQIGGWGSAAPTGLVDLSGTSVGVLDDDNGCGWRHSGNEDQSPIRLRLNGFRYDRLHDDGTLPALSPGRLIWLAQQAPEPHGQSAFSPQPYDQLIETLVAEGRENDARVIAIRKRIARRQFGENGRIERIINFIYQHTFGYGCSPSRAVATMVIYWAIGAGALFLAHRYGMIVPTPEAKVSDCGAFSPYLYALQLLVPLPNLTAGTCMIDQARVLAKAGEVAYALLGAIFLALTILTLSGVTRNEFNR